MPCFLRKKHSTTHYGAYFNNDFNDNRSKKKKEKMREYLVTCIFESALQSSIQ